MNSKRLHLGCGELVGPHWLNVDGSPNVLLDNQPWLRALLSPLLPRSSKKMKFQGVQYLDLRRPWPYADATFDAIFSSHFFEHLSFRDGQHVLRECFRVLRPGGKIRFLMPSIEKEVSQYLKMKQEKNPLAATEFARITNVFQELPEGSWWYRLFFAIYNKNSHKMFYDADSLAYYFSQVGFENIEVRDFLNSDIPDLSEVEKRDRFEGSFCLEAIRKRETFVHSRAA